MPAIALSAKCRRRRPILRVAAAIAMLAGVLDLGAPADARGARSVTAFAPLSLTGSETVRSRVGAAPRQVLCRLRGPARRSSVRGLVNELPQYPNLRAATPAQRVAARRVLERARRTASAWRNPQAARAAGFAAQRPRGRPGDRSIGIFHAEHRRFSADRSFLDPQHPEVLIYANAPRRPLVLIGVMFSVPRGVLGPTPGGPVTRWHSHLVCASGAERGLAPRADGTCPPGERLRRGSEMLHLWFTRDLRSAFAVKAPQPELCALRMLPGAHCRSGRTLRTM